MTTATRIALRRLRARHGFVGVAAALLVVFCGVAAFAYWTTTGSGGASATAATLPVPGSVTGTPSGSTVAVAWTGVTPPGATLNGYYVTRYLGATPSNACGTSPSVPTLIPAGTLTCNDTSVANGTYTYTVTAVFRTWTGTSAASANVVVNADPTPPTQVVSLTSGSGTAYLTGGTVYYRGDLADTFTLSSAVTDAGSGPASATFPAIATAGWTHTLAAPTTGTGSAPTITYAGGTYAWGIGATSPGTHTVTGRDVQGNTVTSNLTFTSDTTSPTGGALVVNGVTGTAGGATGYSSTGTFTGTRTDYSADTGSGFLSSTLRREAGTLLNGVCSAYGAPTVVTGNPTETTLATGCYRYTLTGLDRIGNASVLTTIVQVDNTAPTQVVSDIGPNAFVTGTTLYYRSVAAGSFTLTSTVTDAGTGPKQVVFPAIATAGWTHNAETVSAGTGTNPVIAYTSSTYSWTANPTNPTVAANRTLTASDQANNSGTAVLTFTQDNVVPTGGALTLNATAATAGGSSSRSTTGTFTGTRTDWTDVLSGIGSSVVTREVGTLLNGACSAYGTATTVVGVPSETSLATGCYRYTLTGTDNVGNTSSVATVVQVDRDAPTQVLSETGGSAALTGGTLYYRSSVAGSFTLTSAVTDGESGPASALFPAIGTTGWTHANQTVTTGTGAVPTISYTSAAFTWTALPTNPTGYSVTGADLAGNTVNTALPFVADNAGPTGGVLTVNGTGGSAGGTTSTSGTGTFTGTSTPFTDAASGIATNVITREVGTLTNGACSAYGASTVVAGLPNETAVATGCYRYVLTGTDLVGNTSTVTTVVLVDRTNPTQVLTETGGGAALTGGTLFYRSGVAGSFTLTSAVTDGQLGPASATFPAIATAGWTHNAETVTTGTGAIPTISYTSSSYSWTANPTNPATQPVTGADVVGNTVVTNVPFVQDNTGPTGGALTVNGVAATAGGATGYSTTGTFTGTRTNFSADAGAGFATSVLTREAGTLSNGACSAFGAATTIATTPAETTVAAGCYRYTLTGTDNVGNTSTLTTVIQVDGVAPTQVVVANGPNANITGTTLYYRSVAAGSFTLTSAVTDALSGPRNVTFPAIGTAGWTHNAETVTTGTGTNPTISYTSSTYSWTANPTNPTTAANRTLTATDQANNSGTAVLTFTQDNVAPITGALTVNATAATAGGSASNNGTGTITGTRTDYTDALSGIGSSVLTRSFATVTNGVCGTFGAATTIVGNPNDTGLAGGCYRYTLTGTDNVGNVSSVFTTVTVDGDDPTQVVSMTGGGGVAVLSGTTVYYRPGVAGSFALSTAVTDTGGGPASVAYPAIATTGWTHAAQTVSAGTGANPTITYVSTNFSWTANPTVPAGYTVTGADLAGNTVATVLTFVADTNGPLGGALTVNAVPGTAGGATAYSNTGTYTGTFTNYSTDAGVGFASSVLTREYAATLTNGVCGTYAASTTIGAITETNAAAGCYRYTLTGTDLVGNTSVLSVVVQVDKTNPTMTITDTSPNAWYNTGTNTMYYRGGLASTFNWTASVTDNASGPKEVAYPAIATTGWTHNAETVTTGTGAAPTIAYASSPYSWTPSPNNPAGAVRTITGSDMAGNTVAITPTFVSDTTAPTGGALTVNATAATAGGSTSTSSATTWTIGTRTDYNADTGSGFSSSILTREAAPWNGTTCGTYAAPVTIAGTAAQTGMAGGYCYRYVLTGSDNVGNTATLSTVVRTNLLITSVSLNNNTYTAGTLNRTDTMVVQFSGPINVSSLCSTWTGDTTNQLINASSVVGVTIREGTGGANDYVQVSTSAAACGGAFNFGTVTLGNDGYLASTTTQTFRGTGANASTIAYNAATYTLTITLGINETTPGNDGSNNVNGNTIATYTPGAITGTGGIVITGGGTTANVRQF